MDQNEIKAPDTVNSSKRNKKTLIIIFSVLLALLVVIAAVTALLGGISEKDEKGTVGTVHPSELDITKEEGFDIMEYDEYLALDRRIFAEENGVRVSVESYEEAKKRGAGFVVIYEMLEAVRSGDAYTHNSLMGDDELEKRDFTQQQIYAISVTTERAGTVTDKNGKQYNEYRFIVEYKIHENNGTYRNDIGSDASRKLRYVVNDSTGELLVMSVVYIY